MGKQSLKTLFDHSKMWIILKFIDCKFYKLGEKVTIVVLQNSKMNNNGLKKQIEFLVGCVWNKLKSLEIEWNSCFKPIKFRLKNLRYRSIKKQCRAWWVFVGQLLNFIKDHSSAWFVGFVDGSVRSFRN